MLKSFFYIESSHFDATASQLSCGLCNLGVLRDFEDEEFPPVNVDDLKSPTRKCKKLVKTSQTATRKVLQASYAADSSWSNDLLPNGRDEVYPTSAMGRSIDQPRPAIQALRGKAQSRTDHCRREDPSSAVGSGSLRREDEDL